MRTKPMTLLKRLIRLKVSHSLVNNPNVQYCFCFLQASLPWLEFCNTAANYSSQNTNIYPLTNFLIARGLHNGKVSPLTSCVKRCWLKFCPVSPYTREVAKVIMDSGEWMRSLRTSNVIDRVANTPFRRMIRKMPGLCLLT